MAVLLVVAMQEEGCVEHAILILETCARAWHSSLADAHACKVVETALALGTGSSNGRNRCGEIVTVRIQLPSPLRRALQLRTRLQPSPVHAYGLAQEALPVVAAVRKRGVRIAGAHPMPLDVRSPADWQAAVSFMGLKRPLRGL